MLRFASVSVLHRFATAGDLFEGIRAHGPRFVVTEIVASLWAVSPAAVCCRLCFWYQCGGWGSVGCTSLQTEHEDGRAVAIKTTLLSRHPL